MRRGDTVTVAMTGDYGKPRPAVIVQTDAFPENHGSVILCQITSALAIESDFRVVIEPTAANGLRLRSQIMVDKTMAVQRHRIGRRIGALDATDMDRLNIALLFVMGLSE